MTSYHDMKQQEQQQKQPTYVPSIVGMSTDASNNRKVYDEWAPNYEKDVEKWGYQIPNEVATLLAKHLLTTESRNSKIKINILDAGAGDGLSGAALCQAGFQADCANIVGADISTEMIKIAETRKCYSKLLTLNLNTTPFPSLLLADEQEAPPLLFDAITCIGTMTYVNPAAGTLREFCRIVKPGGFICYTHRTDKLDAFKPEEDQLQTENVWKLVEKLGPMPYLPNNPEYTDKIQVIICLYQTKKI